MRSLVPLVATKFQTLPDWPPIGIYDESAQLRVDRRGRPVASVRPLGDTFTESRREPSDPAEPPEWMFDTSTKASGDETDFLAASFDTITKAGNDEPDDAWIRLQDTETRTTPDPADAWTVSNVESSTSDDPVTGIVAF
jgi:hypothetical protein